MFVFNTTFVVVDSVFGKWELWLKSTYMPLIKNIIPAGEVAVYEVMTNQSDSEKTISVQWKVATPTDLEIINKQSPVLLGQMSSNFGDKAMYFSSILKTIL